METPEQQIQTKQKPEHNRILGIIDPYDVQFWVGLVAGSIIVMIWNWIF